MTNYRRNYVPGGTFFFTVTLNDRCLKLFTEHIDVLRHCFKLVMAELPFTIDAIVILPEHIHTVWTLPSGDTDYSNRWRKIKGLFSQSFASGEAVSLSRQARGERGIWQRRFWEHTIRDELDFQRHIDYIHYNPLKHGYCTRVADWPYSSFARFVERGIYTNNWCGEGVDDDFTCVGE